MYFCYTSLILSNAVVLQYGFNSAIIYAGDGSGSDKPNLVSAIYHDIKSILVKNMVSNPIQNTTTAVVLFIYRYDDVPIKNITINKN